MDVTRLTHAIGAVVSGVDLRAIWDQASTNHRALSDHYPQHRRMRRCTIEGARPFHRPAA